MNKDKEDALEAARLQIGHLGALLDDIVKQSDPRVHTPSSRCFMQAQAELHKAKLIRELGQAEASLEVVQSMLAQLVSHRIRAATKFAATLVKPQKIGDLAAASSPK